MKKLLLLVTIPLLYNAELNAQQVIAVQNGNNTLLYNNLDTAIQYAQNGDTIYLPGGGFSLAVPISKRLYLIGVGHNPDSTKATNYTLISNDIYILSNASLGSLTGIKCDGALRFGNSQANQNVNNYQVSRCYFQGGIQLGFSDSSNAKNNVFYENIIPTLVDLHYSVTNAFYNNIFELVKNIGSNNIFRNNIFNMSANINYSDGYFWYGCNTSFVNAINSTFENNVFRGRLLSSGGYNDQFRNCVFKNNLFAQGNQCGAAYPSCTGCMDFNSVLNQPDSTIFINYPAGQNFQYSLNYQLKSTSLGKNSGSDGTDIGIYGGSSPWKEGGIPFNPHISSKSIETQNDANGNIRIRIKVKAQSN